MIQRITQRITQRMTWGAAQRRAAAETAARTAGRPGDRSRRGGGERPVVPAADFASYYGQPVLNAPVWTADVPVYLFLGGLAGSASVLAAGAQSTGRPALATVSKVGAVGAVGLATGALIHDLGRPARFLNMLRVFKPSSPMSVGSWLLAAYGPAAAGAALSALTGRFPRVGVAATVAAAALGPAVATYTAPLISDTAVPAWHEGYREMPYVFAGSAASAAGGLGLVGAPPAQTAPARRLALAGVGTELIALQLMRRRLGMLARPYDSGRAGTLLRTGKALGALGIAGACLGRHSRVLSALSGLALLGGSAVTRYGIFEAGLASARDPEYTIRPQRERVDAGHGQAATAH